MQKIFLGLVLMASPAFADCDTEKLALRQCAGSFLKQATFEATDTGAQIQRKTNMACMAELGKFTGCGGDPRASLTTGRKALEEAVEHYLNSRKSSALPASSQDEENSSTDAG